MVCQGKHMSLTPARIPRVIASLGRFRTSCLCSSSVDLPVSLSYRTRQWGILSLRENPRDILFYQHKSSAWTRPGSSRMGCYKTSCEYVSFWYGALSPVPFLCPKSSWYYDAGSSLSCSIWCRCCHQARWTQVKLYFPYKSWDIWLNFKFLCTVFFRIYTRTCYCLSKPWWYNICFLELLCMLWMHMLIVYSFMRMTTTSQKKMYHHHFLFLNPKYIL